MVVRGRGTSHKEGTPAATEGQTAHYRKDESLSFREFELQSSITWYNHYTN